MTTASPAPVFEHLLRLTDRRGTFEHALLAEPRPEHGYCTDDMARVLVVAAREPHAEGPVNGLAGAMAAEARRLAPEMAWSVVARGYQGLAHKALSRRRARV